MLSIHPVTKQWSESEITDLCRIWPYMSNEYDTSACDSSPYIPGTTDNFNFDVTEYIQKIVNEERENYGFSIHTYSPRAQLEAKNETWKGGSIIYFYSSECKDKTKRPRLTIDYDFDTKIITNYRTKPLYSVSITNKLIYLNSSHTNNVSFTISTLNGKKLINKELTLKVGENLIGKNLLHAKGIYLLSIKSDKISHQQKLIVK